MQYEDFKQYVAEHVKDYLPPEYKECEVNVLPQRKNNNVIWNALAIKGSGNIVPSIYLESYYNGYENGMEMEDILRHIADTYAEKMKQVIPFASDYFQYEKIRDRIFVTAQNAEMNKEFLKNVPHEIQEDLALVYRVDVALPDGERGSMVVKNYHLDMWEIDENTLKETAWNNMHNHFHPVFFSMEDILERLERDEFLGEEELTEMYVLTNKDTYWGAAYMFDRDVMNRIAENLGSDMLVIPSSIHEVILIKQDADMDLEFLEKLVGEVNRTRLQEIEILSDGIYQYSADTQKLSRIKSTVQKETEMPDQNVGMEEKHDYGEPSGGMIPEM